MIERSRAVGGTEFTLYADDGRIVATAILADSEPEGPLVAHLLAYLSERADAASRSRHQQRASIASSGAAVRVLSLSPRQVVSAG